MEMCRFNFYIVFHETSSVPVWTSSGKIKVCRTHLKSACTSTQFGSNIICHFFTQHFINVRIVHNKLRSKWNRAFLFFLFRTTIDVGQGWECCTRWSLWPWLVYAFFASSFFFSFLFQFPSFERSRRRRAFYEKKTASFFLPFVSLWATSVPCGPVTLTNRQSKAVTNVKEAGRGGSRRVERTRKLRTHTVVVQ